MDFNTTLLREKFVIRDMDREGETPLIAMSNRVVLTLSSSNQSEPEIFVIRAQTMHSCLRMAGQILQTYLRTGPILVRAEPFSFADAWDKSNSDHEIRYNLARWVVVYHNGKSLYASGAHHPFLDVIEKCESKNAGHYDRAVGMAEETFEKMGRKVGISYDANIGMVMNAKPDLSRCGLIHRGPDKNSTFNFMVEPNTERTVSPVLCLNVAAGFLEGLQLAYKIGIVNDKNNLGLLEQFSSEEKLARSALLRLGELNAEIRNFETLLRVRYRPEKPEFSNMVTDAERHHRKIYESTNPLTAS